MCPEISLAMYPTITPLILSKQYLGVFLGIIIGFPFHTSGIFAGIPPEMLPEIHPGILSVICPEITIYSSGVFSRIPL